MEVNEGKVAQVIGAVVDVEFEKNLPAILNGIKVEEPGDPEKGIIHVSPDSESQRKGPHPVKG